MTERIRQYALADLPAQTRQTLRYNDMDSAAHINNVVYSTLFEAGRVPMLYDPDHSMPPPGCHFSLVRIAIEYLSEMTWPGDVVIGSGVTRIGNSSVSLVQGVFKDGQCTAVAESTVVLTDSTNRKSTALPDFARAMFERLVLNQA